MKQNERDLEQQESAGEGTDSTRTERRQAVTKEQVSHSDEGQKNGNNGRGNDGSHQEGQYDKQSNKPEVNK